MAYSRMGFRAVKSPPISTAGRAPLAVKPGYPGGSPLAAGRPAVKLSRISTLPVKAKL